MSSDAFLARSGGPLPPSTLLGDLDEQQLLLLFRKLCPQLLPGDRQSVPSRRPCSLDIDDLLHPRRSPAGLFDTFWRTLAPSTQHHGGR